MITYSDITRLFRSVRPGHGGPCLAAQVQQPTRASSPRSTSAATRMLVDAASGFDVPYKLANVLHCAATDNLPPEHLRDLGHKLARSADEIERKS